MNIATDSKPYQNLVCLPVAFITFIMAPGCASHAAVSDSDCSAALNQTSYAVNCGKSSGAPALDAESRIKAELRKIKGYKRDESQTFLTLPEWYLVYSPAEYAHYLKEKPPSGFPYFGSIGQFWGYYGDIVEFAVRIAPYALPDDFSARLDMIVSFKS